MLATLQFMASIQQFRLHELQQFIGFYLQLLQQLEMWLLEACSLQLAFGLSVSSRSFSILSPFQLVMDGILAYYNWQFRCIQEQDYSLLKARLTVNCNAKLSAAHAGRVSAMLGRLLRAGMHSYLQKKVRSQYVSENVTKHPHRTCALAMTSSTHEAWIQLTNTITSNVGMATRQPACKNEYGMAKNPIPRLQFTRKKKPRKIFTDLGLRCSCSPETVACFFPHKHHIPSAIFRSQCKKTSLKI